MNISEKIIKTSRHDLLARRSILSQYKKLGESKSAIHQVQYEIESLAKTKYKIDSLLPNYLQLLQRVESTREHQIIRIQASRNFKIALHIIPSAYTIPAHSHPDTISAINVLQGELQIEQDSLQIDPERFDCKIKRNQSCAGLFELRNIHRIHSLEKPSIYLSFQLSKHPTFNFKKALYLLAAPLILLSPNSFAPHLTAKEVSHNYSSNNLTISNNKVDLANRFRKGNGIAKDLYRAAQLYKEESSKGNAEAQYWLGVMYFDGAGITEDLDEALRWIAMSSDQKYPQAQKLLKHMLVTDDVSDC